VTTQSTYSFSCRVSQKAEVSVANSTYAGSNGLRRKFVNETGTFDWQKLDAYTSTQSLALTM
jgi:hypothetical protein